MGSVKPRQREVGLQRRALSERASVRRVVDRPGQALEQCVGFVDVVVVPGVGVVHPRPPLPVEPPFQFESQSVVERFPRACVTGVDIPKVGKRSEQLAKGQGLLF